MRYPTMYTHGNSTNASSERPVAVEINTTHTPDSLTRVATKLRTLSKSLDLHSCTKLISSQDWCKRHTWRNCSRESTNTANVILHPSLIMRIREKANPIMIQLIRLVDRDVMRLASGLVRDLSLFSWTLCKWLNSGHSDSCWIEEDNLSQESKSAFKCSIVHTHNPSLHKVWVLYLTTGVKH